MSKHLVWVTTAALCVPIMASGSSAQAAPAPTPPGGSIIAAYSLTAPVGATPSGLVARAIVPNGIDCPVLVTTHASGAEKRTKMRERKAPVTTDNAFAALRSCSANIPAGASRAVVGSRTIPASLPKQTGSIAVFGDTGCRLKGSTVQDCNDPAAWPLARVALSVAREKPDLIVFTGDFFYREAACPDNLASECGASPAPIPGMPFKDSALAWQADVFNPMAPMLASAPIVVTRGNHEACDRGGNGYFIYFDPREGTEGTCAPVEQPDGSLVVTPPRVTPSFAVDVAVTPSRSLRFVVVDSANGWDCEVSSILPQQRAAYVAAQRLAAKKKESWLIVHRPVAAWQMNTDCGPNGGWIAADQQVGSYGLLGDYSVMVSSHIHTVQTMNIPGIPPQVVLGNGGTLLESPVPFSLPVTGPSFDDSLAYPAPTSGWWEVSFGYAMVHPKAGGRWQWDMKHVDGTPMRDCVLAGRMRCSAP